MEQVKPAPYSETQRMELRGQIRLSSEVIGQYWPMRTFVHHNPLHSLEYLHFDEAVKRGKQFLGGKGYLSSDIFRGYLKSGRILPQHLDAALKPLVRDTHVVLGHRRVSHGDVLRACLTQGICAPTGDLLDAMLDGGSDRHRVETLAEHLTPALKPPDVQERMTAGVQADRAALGRSMTLSQWCDRTLGTRIVALIDGELIKWCEAFLDEGHATWPMPGREKDFYGAWKFLAGQEWSPCGIPGSRRNIAQLPDHPEDAVLDSLAALAIPAEFRQDYLSLKLAALSGWAGFIKWRAEQTVYEWQQAYPAGLVRYLAVRLWYVRQLVHKACRDELGIEGSYSAISDYMERHPHAYFMRQERVAGCLPPAYAEQVDRMRWGSVHGTNGWEALMERYGKEGEPRRNQVARHGAARALLAITTALDIDSTVLMNTPPEDLTILLEWMEAFPEASRGPVWLRAFEAGYHEPLLDKVLRNIATQPQAAQESPPAMRPHAQAVFCIDVRSEPFRRNLGACGDYETYGFAGFFAVFIRYRAWGREHETEQFPVIMRAKNEVREIPRTYLDQFLSKHESRARLVRAGHTLLHDLKENVVTPYVMVESLGWFYGLPFIGKAVLPVWYQRWTAWLRRLFVPPISTTLTVDKLTPLETEEMLATEQCATIRQALRERFGLHGSGVTPELIEALRRQALNGKEAGDKVTNGAIRLAGLPAEKVESFVRDLQRYYRVESHWASAQKDRITRTGFTLEEQIVTVETVLRMMGLTRNFARLVLFCAHGSTSDNNPYEAALDCGACGGNEGKPNARVLAAMANKQSVRERLTKNGLEIPSDTHFLAGQVDTTTDEVQVFDLEDVPPTHRKDLAQLLEDLREAGRLTSRERCVRLPEVHAVRPSNQAPSHIRRRSTDWSQVRPEWGLSGNAAFIIGRRRVIKGLNLDGRVFLHSYDYREDQAGRLLEILLTAPQVVAQWINMEHYFSAVDNTVYGGGSKVYHNVVGRFGVLSGPWSDLRLGLAWQTVMSGDVPYHEPMRMLTLIEAPRERIEKLIERNAVLQRFYHNEWVHLVALEPEEGGLYRYLPAGEWRRIGGARMPETVV